jgi:acetoacetate decarboxylase
VGFVKTPEEIAAIERALHEPHFVRGERFMVSFLTEPETYRRLLPPPLRPADQPLVVVGIGRWRSNCVGDYAGGSISLAARHNGVDGGFAVAMWMDSEASVSFGREVFGEPKKLAAANLFHSDDRAEAWIERMGVRLVHLQGDLGPELGRSRQDRIAFNIRSRAAVDGIGLDGPAVLTAATMRTEISSRRVGSGRIELRGTVHDPVDELQVVSVLGCEYQQQSIIASCAAIDTIPAAEFLPFHYGRTDNYAALDTEAAGGVSRRPAVSGAPAAPA